MMEAVCTFETLVSINLTTRQYIPEDSKLQELHNLCSSPDIIRQIKSRRMRWAGHVGRMGEERKLYKDCFLGKPERKRPLGRQRHGWEDGIRVWTGFHWLRIGTGGGLL
jgi:hypothetical protein